MCKCSPTYLLAVLYGCREIPFRNRLGHIPEDNDALLVPDEKLVGVGGAELDGTDLSRLGLGGRLDTKKGFVPENRKDNSREEDKRREMRGRGEGGSIIEA